MRRATLIAAGLVACLSHPALADDPVQVTTDTASYCLGLAQRMVEAGEMPPQVRVLWEQGRGMCQRGHVRGGLARLRRAMMITRGEAE